MQTRKHTVSDGVIRWAYLWEELKPLQTSTCALFWRSAVLSPLKVLAPVCFAGLGVISILWRPIFHSVVEAFFPGSTSPLRPRTSRSPEEIRVLVYVLFGICALGLAGFIAHKRRFFQWLHQFCIPVEIDGGFVRKGSCPSCTGSSLVLGHDERWECRRCRGYFVPTLESAPAIDAVDPHVTK